MRISNNYSQDDLAHFLNINRSTYAYYEIKNSYPPFKRILELATFYGYSPSEFINLMEKYGGASEKECIEYLKNIEKKRRGRI